MTKWVAINLTASWGFLCNPFPRSEKLRLMIFSTYVLIWFYFMAGLMPKWLHWTALYLFYPNTISGKKLKSSFTSQSYKTLQGLWKIFWIFLNLKMICNISTSIIQGRQKVWKSESNHYGWCLYFLRSYFLKNRYYSFF